MTPTLDLLLAQAARLVIVYIFTVVLLRIAGKRRLSQLSGADLMLIIALGSAVGDSMLYPESVVPLWAALLAIAGVVGLQVALGKLVEKHETIAWLVEGRRKRIILNGRVDAQALDDEDLTRDDLLDLLQTRGVGRISDVKEAYLEKSGDLGIVLKETRRIWHRPPRAWKK